MVKKKHIFIISIFILISFLFTLPVFSQTSEQGTVQIDALVPTPETPPETPPGGGAIIVDTIFPVISEIEIIDITRTSVSISWKTNEVCIPQINYGETIDYKKTYIGKSFSIENYISLENLESGTTYHFEIVAIDRAGNRTSSSDNTFKTLPLPDIIPPANISYFEAESDDSQITLKWQNPPDTDFKGVKINRSQKFYPASPEQGMTVYDSTEISFTDTGLENEERYYYTAFSYDESGNYSSGAIISAVPFKIKPPEPPEEPELPIVPPEEVPIEIEKLTLEDFDFFQNGKKITLEQAKIQTDTKAPLTISIPYEKVPEVLKTMMITLKKQDKSFSFLLRINEDKTFYQAKIMPPEPGLYPLTLTILDYKNQTLKKIFGELEIVDLKDQQTIIPWYQQILSLPYIIYILIAILILIVLALFIKNRKERAERSLAP